MLLFDPKLEYATLVIRVWGQTRYSSWRSNSLFELDLEPYSIVEIAARSELKPTFRRCDRI
jgi:hypothetical protein